MKNDVISITLIGIMFIAILMIIWLYEISNHPVISNMVYILII